MADISTAGPVVVDTTWKDQRRHWHCTAVEGLIGERLEVKEDGQHAARSPEEVLAWMEREVAHLAPRLDPDPASGAVPLTLDDELRQLQLDRLTGGRSAGAFVRLPGQRILALDAFAVTPTECTRHGCTSQPAAR